MSDKPPRPAIRHADGILRCPWPAVGDALYVGYHDAEWGVPERDSRALYEKFILDGFQAGLSWITILRKRDAFRAAFDGFRPETIARYGPEKIESLMQDAGIVRNRAKVEGAVAMARLWLDMEGKRNFSDYLWDFFDGAPLQNHWREMGEVPAATPLSEKIAKDMKGRGFKFCGPTIVYAFCQAVGMVNDHLVDCHCHAACKALADKRPR